MPPAERRYRRQAVAVVLIATMLAGCKPSFRDHGYAPSDDELAEIVVGVDTRSSVASSVGTPTSSGVLRDSGYYYVSQRTKTAGVRPTQVVARQIVAISFDDQGVVRNIERFSLEDGKAVALSRRVTDSSVEGLTFFQQLVGSVANFDLGGFLGNGGS